MIVTLPRLGAGFGAALVLALSAPSSGAQTTSTTTTAPAGGFRFGQPGTAYDVSAERQQVYQAENKIVLTGSVEVLNGQARLRTPQLTVFYNNNNGVKGQAPAVGAGVGAVQRMEAEGPVYFVTPTQSAKGDHGTYEAASDTITLVGNVTLLQDKNVASGDRLVINQKTGEATLSSGVKSGRVRGVFYSADKPGAPAPSSAPAPRP